MSVGRIWCDLADSHVVVVIVVVVVDDDDVIYLILTPK